MKSVIKAKLRQYAAAIIANMASFCIGTSLGWTSPSQPLLESAETPIGNPMTRIELSWLGSIPFLGALVGTFFWGRLSDLVGRKTTGLIVAIPHALGWFIILMANETYWLYVGRIFVGLGCSGAVINTPMYVTEIAQDDIRGTLGSFFMFALNLGCLSSFIIGAYTSFHFLTSYCMIVPLVYFLLFSLLPDSPAHLVTKNKKSKAEKSLLWFRGNDPVITEKDLTNLLNRAERKKPGFISLFSNRGRIKGMLIGFGFIIGQQVCGILAIMTYTVTIFKESGSTLPPYLCSIFIACLQCISSFSSSVLVDRAGRKVLLMISFIAMGLSLIALGSYFFYKEQLGPDYSWLPVTSLSVNVIAYSLGAGPVPFIVMSEIFAPEVRGIALSTIQTFGTTLSFLGVKIFPILNVLLGPDGCFLLFGLACLCMSCFTMVCVPETKGKPLHSIIKKLNGELDVDRELVSPGIAPVIVKIKNGKPIDPGHD